MGITERKEKEKEIRRNDIIDAAQNVFFSKGYGAATMDDIAKEAQFSKRTLYVYFLGKEQLYFEIMVRGFKLLNQMVLDALSQAENTDAVEQIRLTGWTVYQFSKAYPHHFSAIMEYENSESDFDASAVDPSMQECYAQGEILFGCLTGLLQRGMEQGSIQPNLDVVNTAFVLWSGTIGALTTASKKANYMKHYHQKTGEEVFATLMDLFERGIRIEKCGSLN